MNRFTIPTRDLTQRHVLPGFALRDTYLTMGPDPNPGQVLAWFNASSVVHEGKRWMAYRTECKRWFMWSQISVVQIDHAMIPIPGTNRILKLQTRFDGWGAEDPRMFVYDGSMYVSYGDGYRMMLAQLDAAGDVVRCGAIPSDVLDKNHPTEHPREKNWGFFEFEGRLFCQQEVSPLVTWEFDPKTWRVINKWESRWRWTSAFGRRINGGAPPVLHDGLYWRWVHSHRNESMPNERKSWWSDKPVNSANRYYPHLMCFKAEPPFDPVAISQRPVFFAPWEHPDTVTPTWHSVAYVGSAEREKDGWRLFYGENDCRIVTAHFTDEEAHASLVEAPKSAPRALKRAAKNHLHFIWMQGVSEIPDADAARIRRWKDLNPDWQISQWDAKSLRAVIADKASSWLRPWDELAAQIERNNDVAMIAKASDLGRLILLSLRFNGEQAWNVYADTDTEPHRSLTDFFNDDTIYGGNMGKAPVFRGDISERAWDSDNYDLILTQENLMTSVPGYMTNAVMMARPGALAINAVLEAGVLTRNRPTLKAFGPIMLRQTIDALKRTPDGRRVDVLPYHYLVWNQDQMKMIRPNWTVCSHLNHFRWRQEGVRTTNAGVSGRVTLH